MLRIEGVRKSFGDHVVLDGIDLHVQRGEVVCLIGASGSGKSTLLRCIDLLELTDDGGRGEPDDGACAVLGLPCSAERVHGGGLARSSGADEHIEDAAGDGDRRQGCGLVVAEHESATVRPAGDTLELGEVERGSGQQVGSFEQAIICGQ